MNSSAPNNRHKVRIKLTDAYSLPELLVVMIITGVIILVVADGLYLLKNSIAKTAILITSNTDSVVEYYKNHMYTIYNGKVLEADSVRYTIQDSLFAALRQKEQEHIKRIYNKDESICSKQEIVRQ